MTAVPTYAPGLAAQSEDVFTQRNAKWFKAPTQDSAGTTFNDLAENELIGRVTITGALIRSVPTANDGSQNPIGVTAHAVPQNAGVPDSNSNVDSNSTLEGEGRRVVFYVDGEFNFDELVKDSAWTVDSLRRNLEANGQSFGVKEIKTATPSNVGLE